MYLFMCDYEKALKLQYKFKEIFEKEFGPKHGKVAEIIRKISVTYNLEGNYLK